MTNDEQYVPDEMDARECFLDGAAGAYVREDWEAFLARVRRDAAREALDGLAIDLAVTSGYTEAEEVRDYRDAHYPEGAEHG